MADPRLASPPQSVNEALLDRMIRRALRVQRYAVGEAAWIRDEMRRSLIPRVIRRVTARLADLQARGFAIGPGVSKTVDGALQSIDTIVEEEIRRLAGASRDRMLALSVSESAWTHRTLEALTPEALRIVKPTDARARSVVTARPFQGRLLRSWYSGLEADTKRRVRASVRIGITQGETLDDIVRRLRGEHTGKFVTRRLANGKLRRYGVFRGGVLDTTTRNAEAIARTATSHVSNHARQVVYEENASLIEGVRWVATLDGRTTLQCISLDGSIHPIDSGPRPPIHFGCRSSTAPVLKGWDAVGLKPGDLEPSERASMDGLVPGDLRYKDWLRQQDASFQDEVLGPARGKLFRDGVDPGRFVGRDLRPLTLEQLDALN